MDDIGILSNELEGELWIWRPVMARLVTLESIKSGNTTIEDLLKLNALLDMRNAISYKGSMESKI